MHTYDACVAVTVISERRIHVHDDDDDDDDDILREPSASGEGMRGGEQFASFFFFDLCLISPRVPGVVDKNHQGLPSES